jgi:hypothetical protein
MMSGVFKLPVLRLWRVWQRLGVFVGVLAAFGSATASSPVIVPFRVAGHFPIVIAKVDGVDVPLAFGSGDSFPVRLEQSVLDQIKAVPLDAITWGLDAKGHLLKSPKFRVSRQKQGHSGIEDA